MVKFGCRCWLKVKILVKFVRQPGVKNPWLKAQVLSKRTGEFIGGIVQSVSTDFCYETGVFNPRRIGEIVVDLSA